MDFKEVKIEGYIPEEYINKLREELNAVGACKIGYYDNCMSIMRTWGYWRPLKGSSPFEGKVGEISSGEECKVEVRCKNEYVKDAIKAIKKVHPYEEPVYNIIPLINYMVE
jgi:hypothetical protein